MDLGTLFSLPSLPLHGDILDWKALIASLTLSYEAEGGSP